VIRAATELQVKIAPSGRPAASGLAMTAISGFEENR